MGPTTRKSTRVSAPLCNIIRVAGIICTDVLLGTRCEEGIRKYGSTSNARKPFQEMAKHMKLHN